METVTIVNANPDQFKGQHYDFRLPSNFYFYGPIVMLNPRVRPKDQEGIIEVPGDITIRETFDRQGFQRMDGKVVTARILPTEQRPNPMNYFPGGYNHSNSIIVPDDIKWGELFKRCMELEDLCQTEFFPIAAAPTEAIEAFIIKMLKEKGR